VSKGIDSRLARIKRHARLRQRVKGRQERPRLNVFRSLNHIYAQLVDDAVGHTIASSSSLDPEVKAEAEGKTKTAIARVVGLLIAERAKEKGVREVVFDRGGFKYHGRIKALAEAARKAGLIF
jgi:large subunit ribosomal protein L18